MGVITRDKANLLHTSIPNHQVTEGCASKDIVKELLTMCDIMYDDPNSIPWDDNLAGVMRPPAKQLAVDIENPLFKQFKGIILNAAGNYIDNYLHTLQEIGQGPTNDSQTGEYAGDLNYKISLMTCWTVHQYENDYNPVHNHTIPGMESGISGFIHLRVPEGCYEIENSDAPDGLTMFSWGINPKNFVNEFRFSPLASIIPTVGVFYMFPMWLNHQVYPFKGPGQRLSISWNLGVEWGDGLELIYPPAMFKRLQIE